MTHISVSKVTNIGSDNGLSPGRRQAIILTFRNKLQWYLIEIHAYSLKNALQNVIWKMASILPRPKCVNGIVHENKGLSKMYLQTQSKRFTNAVKWHCIDYKSYEDPSISNTQWVCGLFWLCNIVLKIRCYLRCVVNINSIKESAMYYLWRETIRVGMSYHMISPSLEPATWSVKSLIPPRYGSMTYYIYVSRTCPQSRISIIGGRTVVL